MNLYQHSKKLPMFDWNICFFGAHSQKVPDDWSVPLNQHSAFELIYVINGCEKLTIHSTEYLIHKNDFVLICPGVQHQIKSNGNLEYFCFHFNIDDPLFISRLDRENKVFYDKHTSLNASVSPLILKLINILKNENNQLTISDFKVKLQIQIILSNILIAFHDILTLTPVTIGLDKVQIATKISNEIKNNFTLRAFSPNEFCDESDLSQKVIQFAMQKANVSNSYGGKIFKQTFGESPRGYLSSLKIEYAKQMLIMPTTSIEIIANHLGYTSVSNFSRQFKRWTGQSPSEYCHQFLK